jgi:hypothetical protein
MEDQDQEIEGEELFQSRIGSENFGTKRCGTFAGRIWVMKPVVFLVREKVKYHSVIFLPLFGVVW